MNRTRTTTASQPRAAKPPNKSSGVRTLRVAARVLEALTEFRQPARIAELARKLDMTIPTVWRHVSTWRELGFIDKAEPLDAYRLGTRLFSLGQAAAEQNTHVSAAYPHLLSLRDSVGETTLWCAGARGEATVLACLDSGRPTTIVVRPGTVLRLPYSPTARVLWAFSAKGPMGKEPTDDRIDFSQQPGLNRKKFKKKIEHALAQFYDYEIDVERSMGGISCPVFDHGNNIVAAVTLVLPSASITDPPKQKTVASLRDCAAQISQALGSTAWQNK